MSSFIARTRLRGEIEYYKAVWLPDFYGPSKRGAKFLEGRHQGDVFPEEECAIAKNDEYLLGEK